MGPGERTRLLLHAPPAGVAVDEVQEVVGHLRSRLVRVSAGVAGSPSAGGPAAVPRVPVDVDRAALRRVSPAGAPDPAPFRWRPAYVRRSLGLAVVEACAAGLGAAPADVVEAVAGGAVEEWRMTGRRRFHWESWFDGLAPGARALVLAEALTWATSLWCSLDWPRLATRTTLGGADERAAVAAPVPVRLRARAEARVCPPADGYGEAPGDGHGERSGGGSGIRSVVTVGTGVPGPHASEELAFVALVGAVRAPRRPVPSVVLGLWPDAGEERVITIDGAALRSAADRVVAVVEESLAGRSRPDVLPPAPPSELAAGCRPGGDRALSATAA